MKHRNMTSKFMSITEMVRNMNKARRTMKLKKRKKQNRKMTNRKKLKRTKISKWWNCSQKMKLVGKADNNK